MIGKDMKEKIVYGICIIDYYGQPKSINELNNQERFDLIKTLNEEGKEVERYSVEKFFDYLNQDRIDTENKYWIIIEEEV